ncbi:MAG: hypothetical protein LBD75_07435 [Candidatus Peribacteria bacterium]|jgi:hypothetical protein|nr:hypothetical protein [Candidatus Peribacteria bacterium]
MKTREITIGKNSFILREELMKKHMQAIRIAFREYEKNEDEYALTDECIKQIVISKNGVEI